MKRLLQSIEQYFLSSDRVLWILSLFTCVYFVFRDFGIRMIYGYALLLLLVFVIILRNSMVKTERLTQKMQVQIVVLAGFILLSFIRPDSRHDADTVSYIIAMVICSAFVFMSNPSYREIEKCYNLFLMAAGFFALYVIFFVIKPDLFWKTIYHYISQTAAEYLKYYVPKGYSISIGGVTYTNYILFMGIACSLGLYATQKEWKQHSYLRYLLLIVVFSAAILMTGRRGEFLGVVITCIIVFILSGNLSQRLRRILFLACLAIGGLLLIIAFLPILKRSSVLYRYVLTIEKLMTNADVSSGRGELYALAWSKFLEKPVQGIGWASFSNFISKAFRKVHGNVADVHNIYLQFLCETGIPGALIIISLLLSIYYQATKRFLHLCKVKAENASLAVIKAAGISAFSIQTFLLIMGIFDPCFERLVFWCFYGISVILSSGAGKLYEQYLKNQP